MFFNYTEIQPIIPDIKDIEEGQSRLYAAFKKVLLGEVGKIAELIKVNKQSILADPLASNDAYTSGPYFAMENVMAGSLIGPNIEFLNNNINFPLNLPLLEGKRKLGPGIAFVKPPNFFTQLISYGQSSPELACNYTGPGGTSKIREALATIVNIRLGGELTQDDVFLLPGGTTQGIDSAMEAISQIFPGSEVLLCGLSYYTCGDAARAYELPVIRSFPKNTNDTILKTFLPSAKEIELFLTSETKTLVITSPSNPSGETYSGKDFRDIVRLAKNKGLIILYDAVFTGLEFDDELPESVMKISREENYEEGIVVVDGISKRYNSPGARIGWLATCNSSLKRAVQDSSLIKMCNPPLIYEPLIRFIAYSEKRNSNVPIENQDEPDFLTADLIDTYYQEWLEWRKGSGKVYRQNYELIKELLPNMTNTEAGFNTFVRMSPAINQMDYSLKMLLLTGNYTQYGPWFGLQQYKWEEEIGNWMRISFGCRPSDLISMLASAIAFDCAYSDTVNKQSAYLELNYNNQI